MTVPLPDPTSITQLTPLLLLERAADVYPDKIAISYRDRELTYRQFRDGATRVGRALLASGITPGDRVAYLMQNLPEMLIAHFAVPLVGAVLVAINTRLSGSEIAYILDHSGASLLVVDAELYPTIASHLGDVAGLREVVVAADDGFEVPAGVTGYQELVGRGSDEPLDYRVDDEHRAISIDYTSGTTGRPKGSSIPTAAPT